MKLLIGICGRSRHGKDTLARGMMQHFTGNGWDCQHLSVSQVIVEEAYRQGHVKRRTREELTPDELKVIVEMGHARAGLWLLRALENLDDSGSKIDVGVVTGRFIKNEPTILRARGGVLVRMVRVDEKGYLYASSDRDPNDTMETSQDGLKVDFEVFAASGLVNVDRVIRKGSALAACLEHRLFQA